MPASAQEAGSALASCVGVLRQAAKQSAAERLAKACFMRTLFHPTDQASRAAWSIRLDAPSVLMSIEQFGEPAVELGLFDQCNDTSTKTATGEAGALGADV